MADGYSQPWCNEGDNVLGIIFALLPMIFVTPMLFFVILPQQFGARGHPEEWKISVMLRRLILRIAKKEKKRKEKHEKDMQNPKKKAQFDKKQKKKEESYQKWKTKQPKAAERWEKKLA